ncbi:MAG: hypothetical protein B6I38_03285 [Anaerolineaceae bacterium 4572_5.1]|nr:MAG: hypothetical protein B6I38_03285 [Anaerolineaceae bacterium 4572_5.1]RLD06255.1 MAG: hypothetical protein DRI56_08340 [Chloroflexota bacterium]
MKLSPLLGVFVILVSIFIGGCSVIPLPEELPTLIPEDHVPTVIALTAQALIDEKVLLPTKTPIPEPVATEIAAPSPSPTETAPPTPELTATLENRPSPTPTPTIGLASTPEVTLPARIPYGKIQFLAPGDLSKVVSPIHLHTFISPGSDGEVWVALFGEDGRLLVRDVFTLIAEGEYKVHLVEDLEFEISGVAETARLEIRTYDEHGRLVALATQDLVLLSTGTSDVNLPRDLYEGIIIQQPVSSTLIQGGELIVSGITRHAPKDQLYVELVDNRGSIVGSQIIGVSEKELGEGYSPYAGKISYQVGGPTWVQVRVTARDGLMSGVVHVSSVVVLLSP